MVGETQWFGNTMRTSYTKKGWSELRHAYGSAEDVPALLVRLNSDDKQVREDALGELFGSIWHQGTVYPATARALQELIALFRSPDCKDHESVIMLIASIADGDGFFHVHRRLDSLREDHERILAERGSSIAKEIQQEADYLKEIRDMSIEVLPLITPFLDSPEWCIRETVVGVFQRYAEHIPDVCIRLEQRLSVETNEDVKQRIYDALAEIKQAQQCAAHQRLSGRTVKNDPHD